MLEPLILYLYIRRRSDYMIRFIAPAICPNKSKKLTPLIAPTHNIRGKVWMKNNIHFFTDDNCLVAMFIFHSNLAVYIVCQHYKPCEFLWFVWTNCRFNKSYYVITSLAKCIINESGVIVYIRYWISWFEKDCCTHMTEWYLYPTSNL